MRRWFAPFVLVVFAACGGSEGGKKTAPAVTVDVSAYFPAGTVVRDAYSDATTTVSTAGTVTVTPAPEGVVLLEQEGAAPTPFLWKNGVTYFLMTDRFFDGDASNNLSYGRRKDGAQEVGTFHGGDWKGVTAKLDYLQALGVTSIWISPIVEQVHGWVAGGSGAFRHYAYAGYWALDFTRLDQNFGTLADLQALVAQAHQRGIRVLVDVVVNHPGYATGADLVAYLPEVFTDGTGAAFQAWEQGTGLDWNGWNNFVNYSSPKWANWWGVNWIRAGLGGGYQTGGSTDETLSLVFLPDFKTEASAAAGLPPFLAPAGTVAGYTTPKADTGATVIAGGTVRDHLVKWHADWVRATGIDGFRCDTVKNVDKETFKALKDAAIAALAEWKAANPAKKIDDAPFWMTGELYGRGLSKDAYYTDGGFDSLINFSFQNQLATLLTNYPTLVDGSTDLNGYFAGYSGQLANDPAYDVLSYVSSHDTLLFYERFQKSSAKQRDAGTALLLSPGGVQIYYGDESARAAGPGGGDSTQGTRSDMNWSSIDAGMLSHWTKLANFRKRHAAIGAGQHAKLTSPDGTYAFARTWASGGVTDKVVVILTKPE